VSQWADANRILCNTSPEPGAWRTDRTPFLREIMDSLTPSAPCERVVFVKSAQCGGTELLLNACGYLMHHAPAPTLLVQPSVEMAKRFSKQRLDAMIENTPALRGRVKDPQPGYWASERAGRKLPTCLESARRLSESITRSGPSNDNSGLRP
jgi:phage terminase large subunit GpA-like protein